jgi:hypothetical protein
VTDYWIRYLITDTCLNQTIQTRCGISPASNSIGARGTFPWGGGVWPGREADHTHPCAEVQNARRFISILVHLHWLVLSTDTTRLCLYQYSFLCSAVSGTCVRTCRNCVAGEELVGADFYDRWYILHTAVRFTFCEMFHPCNYETAILNYTVTNSYSCCGHVYTIDLSDFFRQWNEFYSCHQTI